MKFSELFTTELKFTRKKCTCRRDILRWEEITFCITYLCIGLKDLGQIHRFHKLRFTICKFYLGMMIISHLCTGLRCIRNNINNSCKLILKFTLCITYLCLGVRDLGHNIQRYHKHSIYAFFFISV